MNEEVLRLVKKAMQAQKDADQVHDGDDPQLDRIARFITEQIEEVYKKEK